MDAQTGTIGTVKLAGRAPVPRLALCVFILIVVTMFSRASEFNNPLSNVDDQFYLFMGKAMLHGELPYVDVWDRKPIGLFLIYEGIAALGGNSVILYHLVAAAAAFATALVVMAISRRFTTTTGGLRAAIVYLLVLSTMGGASGQAPVFYNLLIALAALMACDAFACGARRWPRALGAMLLAGLAIQVKPTTLFEGAFFGLLFMAAEWRAARSAKAVAALAAAMAVTAALPSAVAFGVYAVLGHASDMWFATAVSIFQRTPLDWRERLSDVPQMALFLTVPLLVCGSSLWSRVRDDGWSPRSVFLVGWCGAAVVGYLSVPNFFNHYSLPLILPMSVAAAKLLADRRDGLILTAMIAVLPLLVRAPSPGEIIHNPDGFERTAGFVRSRLNGGCLYVYLGPTQLYTATNSCHVSPYVFPDHLESAVEATALPVNPEAEVERIFATAPSVVTTMPRHYLKRNNRTAAIVERHLWCDYGLARRVPVKAGMWLDIWTRRPGRRLACPTTHPPLGIIQDNGS